MFHSRCERIEGMLTRRVVDLEGEVARLYSQLENERATAAERYAQLADRVIELSDPQAAALNAERTYMAKARAADALRSSAPAPSIPRIMGATNSRPAGRIVAPHPAAVPIPTRFPAGSLRGAPGAHPAIPLQEADMGIDLSEDAAANDE